MPILGIALISIGIIGILSTIGIRLALGIVAGAGIVGDTTLIGIAVGVGIMAGTMVGVAVGTLRAGVAAIGTPQEVRVLIGLHLLAIQKVFIMAHVIVGQALCQHLRWVLFVGATMEIQAAVAYQETQEA
jgi:hypothetical protein